MESINEPTEIQPVSCENCSALNPPDRKFCSQCRYPIGGADEEKQNFRFSVTRHKHLLAEAQKRINTAKTIMYVLAGIFFLYGLYEGFGNDDFVSCVVNLLVSTLFLIFAAWCKHNPFAAILTAFFVYVTLHVLNAFIDPATLASGVVVKILFVAAFVKGIRSAQEAKGYLDELKKLKAAPVGDE